MYKPVSNHFILVNNKDNGNYSQVFHINGRKLRPVLGIENVPMRYIESYDFQINNRSTKVVGLFIDINNHLHCLDHNGKINHILLVDELLTINIDIYYSNYNNLDCIATNIDNQILDININFNTNEYKSTLMFDEYYNINGIKNYMEINNGYDITSDNDIDVYDHFYVFLSKGVVLNVSPDEKDIIFQDGYIDNVLNHVLSKNMDNIFLFKNGDILVGTKEISKILEDLNGNVKVNAMTKSLVQKNIQDYYRICLKYEDGTALLIDGSKYYMLTLSHDDIIMCYATKDNIILIDSTGEIYITTINTLLNKKINTIYKKLLYNGKSVYLGIDKKPNIKSHTQ